MSEVTVRTRVAVPLQGGVKAEFVTFNNLADGREHLAIVYPHNDTVPLVRIHSQCLTGDVFGSCRCDCGKQLEEARILFAARGGIILYMQHEGRGNGLFNKLAAYALQDKGMDTYEADKALGLPEDARSYDVAASMLVALNISRVRLVTNNPLKVKGLREAGIAVDSVVPTGAYVTPENRKYLAAKVAKTGHTLKLTPG